MAEASPTITLKFPAGIDNRSREYALAEGAARQINNTDVTRDGGLRCRDGLRQVTSGNCHSLYAPSQHRFALLAKDNQLCRLDADETTTALTTVTGPVVYALLNDEVFWSDGAITGRVRADGTTGVWGLATPAMPPYSLTSGDFTAGDYLLTMTAVQIATGLESGAGEPISVTVPANGGIQVTALTASGFSFAFYLTPPYGERHELRCALVVDSGTSAVLSASGLGRPIRSLLAIKPLPSQALVSFKGRLWAASGKVVWFTSELSPHWLFPHEGYYQFESDVTMLGATEDGIYVGLYDRVYYLQGSDPYQMAQRPVANVGALQGGGAELPYDLFVGQGGLPTRSCFWWDSDGVLCVGKPGGIIARPNADRYAAGEALTSVGCYRAHNGLRQVVSALDGNDAIAGRVQATDVEISEIFSNGVALFYETSSDMVIVSDSIA